MDWVQSFIIVLVILNLVVSIFVFTREDLDRFQKVAQTIIVWVVPVLGGISIWLFNRSRSDVYRPPKSRSELGHSSMDVGSE